MKFQSLFCWMLFWKRKRVIQIRSTKQVSILVLLDVILKELLSHLQRFVTKCFNPCFVGCYSESEPESIGYSVQTMFQSLFCWMLFWKSRVASWSISLFLVSILVLLDVILKDLIPTIGRRRHVCFNPCFVGCYSESLSWDESLVCHLEFQSLFCWMLFWKGGGLGDLVNNPVVSILVLLDVILKVFFLSLPLMRYIVFQSLFCWMLFWKQLWCRQSRKVLRFQSLFCWMLFWK